MLNFPLPHSKLRILPYFIVCTAFLTSFSCFAEENTELLKIQDSDDDVIELDEIDIQENADRARSIGARPVFSEKIDEPNVQSVSDWLETANGVYGDSSGKGTRSVIVRGFESRQIDFQFNDMPIESSYDDTTVLDIMPVNWLSAGRIAHADDHPTDGAGLGGKIDFFAFDPSLLEANLAISPSEVMGAIAHGMTVGSWRWAATIGGQYSNGFYLSHAFEPTEDEDGGLRNSSHKESGNFLVKVGKTLGSWGDVEIMTGWTQAPLDIPVGVNADFRHYWRFSSWRMGFAMARLSWMAHGWEGQFLFWANDQGNTLETYDDASYSTQKTASASTSTWQNDDYGLRTDLSSEIWQIGNAGFMRALLRADLRFQTHRSDEDDYAPARSIHKDSSRFVYDIRPALEYQITPSIRLFAAGNAKGAKGLTFNASNNDSFDLKDVHDGGFSLGLDDEILKNLNLSFRAARRLRLPSLKEMYKTLPSDIASELDVLKPESAWDFEAEIHYSPIETVALSVGIFDTEVRDLIGMKYIQGIKSAYNVAKARIAGTDIALKLGSWAGFSFDISYHYLYAYDLSEDHELNDRPAHNLRASVIYEPLKNLRLSVGMQFESKRRTEEWTSSRYAWLGNIYLLNAEVEYHIEHFSIWLRGTNLTDYNYARSIGYPEPGINVTLGAKVCY